MSSGVATRRHGRFRVCAGVDVVEEPARRSRWSRQPPAAIASRALATRLISTCSSCPASANTWSGSAGEPELERLVRAEQLLQQRRQVSPPAAGVRRMDGRRTCWRLKARSCWVIPRPRDSPRGPSGRRRADGSDPPRDAEHEAAEPDHHGHHVVHFMGDAAGELAHRLQPLGLRQLFLHPLVRADLPPRHDAAGDPALLVPDRSRVAEEGTRAPPAPSRIHSSSRTTVPCRMARVSGRSAGGAGVSWSGRHIASGRGLMLRGEPVDLFPRSDPAAPGRIG